MSTGTMVNFMHGNKKLHTAKRRLKMKKKVLSTVLASAMALSLAACGSSADTAATTDATGATATESTSETAAVDTGDKIVIEVWSEDRHDEDYIREMIDKFNEENTDNIYVRYA